MGKIPRIFDYYQCSEDDDVMTMSTKLCIVQKEELVQKDKQILIIREIHHLGDRLWLGIPKRIESSIYEKVDGENGPINIITEKCQYLVPRKIEETNTSKIAIYNGDVYTIKPKASLKEIVLKDNTPNAIDYTLEDFKKYPSYEGRGVKAYIELKKNDNLEVVIVD